MMQTRRAFIGKVMIGISTTAFGRNAFAAPTPVRKPFKSKQATVWRSVNGCPKDNLKKVVEMIGGIGRVVGADDVVVIKPNVQWFNQGAPNLSAMKTFVDLIMQRPGGFNGEVVIAENTHRGAFPWKHSGWAKQFKRNTGGEGLKSYNQLVDSLKKAYGDRFTAVHWIDVDSGGKRVFGPQDGPGYVYCDGTGGVPLIAFDNGKKDADFRRVIMTYPIFETDRKTVVDFKNGIWENGAYTAQPVKYINFAALNHHSTYCGATSAIKNYLGVSDLSGGPDPHNNGKLTDKYYNFHSFPFDKWAPGPEPGMIGAEIGVFLDTVRAADLNITTADWIGIIDRTETPVARTRAVLASADPVALDYHAAKYLLYPNSRVPVHNPDNEKGPLYHYLKKCGQYGKGVLDEGHVEIQSYDFKADRLQKDAELMVKGDITWGTDVKMLLKYLVIRFLPGMVS